MTTQPEALQMAKDFESYAGTLPDRCYFEAATELRRLHSVNQDLLEALKLASTMLATGMPEYDAADVKAVVDDAIAKATGEMK